MVTSAYVQYDLSKLGFLMIDPCRHLRALIRSVFDALGVARFDALDDTTAGLAAIERLRPDIVIVEWELAPISGADFVRAIRREAANPYVPIIMLTGHTEAGTVLAARDAGINAFMAKPTSARALYERITWIIDHPVDFIRSDVYFGPDRRHQMIDLPPARRRRYADRFSEPEAAS
jgi:two-component system, chemotaxis family, chemotaxis protein CheY